MDQPVTSGIHIKGPSFLVSMILAFKYNLSHLQVKGEACIFCVPQAAGRSPLAFQ